MTVPDFALLETMRWEPEVGYPFLSAHLGRLTEAAAFFGVPLDEAAVRRTLDTAVEERDAAARVRLTVDGRGATAVMVMRLVPTVEPWRVAVYPEAVEAGGPFWRHKTTHRPHYEAPYRWAQGHGLDDALLVDAAGHVVEATRANVWVENDGRWTTPPTARGGLPGIYRAHLLATRPYAVEAVLRAHDLQGGGVYLSNAVRGLVRAEVVPV